MMLMIFINDQLAHCLQNLNFFQFFFTFPKHKRPVNTSAVGSVSKSLQFSSFSKRIIVIFMQFLKMFELLFDVFRVVFDKKLIECAELIK